MTITNFSVRAGLLLIEFALVHKPCQLYIYSCDDNYQRHTTTKGRIPMQVKEKMTGLLSLPKEIALNLPLITAIGREEVNIENYKKLVEFTDTKIRVQTTSGMLSVDGQGLNLKQVTTEHVLITGKIKGIQW